MRRISFIKRILVRRTKRQLLLEVLNLLIGYPLYLFSFLFFKDKKKWVLGNKLGFSDNAKYLYLYIAKQTEVDAYWITSDKKLVSWLRKRNLLAFYKYSLKGLYHSLTAYMYIYTTSPNAINFFTSGGSKLVNLWHGVGIKNLLKCNSGIGNSNLMYKILMPYASKKPDYILTTSLLMNDYFKKVFSVNEDAVINGIYPRCDFICSDLEYIRDFICKYENQEMLDILSMMEKYDRIYLYMPTWRADLKDAYLDIAFPDFVMLNKHLSNKNALMLIKQHPSITHINKQLLGCGNIKFIDNKYDVYPILPFTDILITDYSSIYYDYLLMENKGIILYPFDFKTYQQTEYQLSLDYEKYMPGVFAYKFEDLLKVIENNTDCSVLNRDWVLEMFWGNYKDKHIEGVYKQLLLK